MGSRALDFPIPRKALLLRSCSPRTGQPLVLAKRNRVLGPEDRAAPDQVTRLVHPRDQSQFHIARSSRNPIAE